MDGADRRRAWTNLKQRLRFKGLGCCGASWAFTRANMGLREDAELEEEVEEEVLFVGLGQIPAPNGGGPAASMMNLAAALAAERNARPVRPRKGPTLRPRGGDEVKSLMRLMEEADGDDERETAKEKGNDGVCCVCMTRNKGAAFIPCGHTCCRICSRELVLSRGSCPICNRSILDVLDIF
ncbi:probable E3 ubiquitin-protein ligase LUL1 [Malania oleifera]|uniref:probable E3 ubiquitin-protein ligase LUL1 n=1 Tax=Malania oleifera TaxID=397392 RepID=UPI0025AEC5E4|nr:probable E3 ubiquitin-protein ligase LUL1 [Malania oleifera]